MSLLKSVFPQLASTFFSIQTSIHPLPLFGVIARRGITVWCSYIKWINNLFWCPSSISVMFMDEWGPKNSRSDSFHCIIVTKACQKWYFAYFFCLLQHNCGNIFVLTMHENISIVLRWVVAFSSPDYQRMKLFDGQNRLIISSHTSVSVTFFLQDTSCCTCTVCIQKHNVHQNKLSLSALAFDSIFQHQSPVYFFSRPFRLM